MPPRLLFITIIIIMTITTTITIISFTVITVLYFQPFLLPLAGLPIGSASRILLQVLFLPFVIWKRCQVPFDNKRQYQVSLYLQKKQFNQICTKYLLSRPNRWSLWYWYLDVYVDHLYFQIQVTEKYSTAMCYQVPCVPDNNDAK